MISEESYAVLRRKMVDSQLLAPGRDIVNPKVIEAMLHVPRHLFIPEEMKPNAYEDRPLPLGEGQTISQPYIVALMTQSLRLDENAKVLEIGTGCGYQTAILAELVGEVYSIERVASLAEQSKINLSSLGYKNIHLKEGDGYWGWPEFAPYDGILVTCAPNDIPFALKQQLKIGGRMIIPVGDFQGGQDLIYLEKKKDQSFITEKVCSVRFVPMTGEAQRF